MDPFSGPTEELPAPPSHLFERLALIPGYTWDQSIDPFHSVSPMFTLHMDVRSLIASPNRVMTTGMSSESAILPTSPHQELRPHPCLQMLPNPAPHEALHGWAQALS